MKRGLTPLEIIPQTMFYAYVIKSKKDNKWYTGYTKDLRKRFQEHNANKVFSTKRRGPFELIYYEASINEEDARMREKYLKSGMGKRYLKNRLKRFLSLTGLTLIELLMVIVLLTALIWVSFYIFRITLIAWSSQETRTGVEINIDSGMEEMVRDIREAKAVQSANDQIRFTRDAADYYIYYLYNASDSYPPAFNQPLYQVKKAVLTGGIGGTFTYGSGQLMMTDVLPPPASDLSESGNVVTIDISIKRNNETVRSKTGVKLRNI